MILIFCLLAGNQLAFVVYPQALSMLPMAKFWTVIFMLMLVALGSTSTVVCFETIIEDLMKFLRIPSKYKFLAAFGIALCFYISQLSMTTYGGAYVQFLLGSRAGITMSTAAIVFLAIAIILYGKMI